MKQYILLILFGVIAISPAFATNWNDDNCTNRDGTIVTANDGTKFCRSNNIMNWWSANVWCQKHGGVLTDYKKFCGLTALYRRAGCPNMPSCRGWKGWFSQTEADGTAWHFLCNEHFVYNNPRSQLFEIGALCE